MALRTKHVWAALLALGLLGAQAQPPAIPDAPRPQVQLPTVTPGAGTAPSTSSTTSASGGDATPAAPEPQTPSAPAAASDAQPGSGEAGQSGNEPATVVVPAGQGEEATRTIMVHVNEVDIAFTVKDSKGRLVAGIRPAEVQVFENGLLQHLDQFTDDALSMSVALVIDQTLTHGEMDSVNTAMGALQDAFTKFDEITVYTYNKEPKQVTDFTGAQSPRLAQAIEVSKAGGRDALMAGSLGGPLAQTTVINNMPFDPNTQPVRGHNSLQLNPEREFHPLNDAILAAAEALRTQPVGRRRVIYVISNGNEYGSKAKYSEVVKVLQTNGIEVDGTLVGDSAVWGIGMLDRIHLPLEMRDNVLTPYANATGGNIDAEFRTAAIERSFAKVASEARNRYTVAWRTHEPFVDGKYRKLNITILRPDLTVLAPPGYWPAAQELRQQQRPATAPTGAK